MSILPGLEGYAGRDVALGQWDTDPILARALARWAHVEGLRVLEPSCGIGNVMKACKHVGAKGVFGVELDPHRAWVAQADGFDVAIASIFDDITLDEADVAVGNPPFENHGALRHAVRWLDFAERACFIAPLETLAGPREGLWDQLHLTRVAVCTPRPPFGEKGTGMSEIAFFEVYRPTILSKMFRRASLDHRFYWREVGTP